jgi:uncharacterized protein (TIGR02246 family)
VAEVEPAAPDEPRDDALLQELADRQAIADLIHAYCLHFDGDEPAEVAALFTPEATVDYGPEVPTLVGRDAILAAVTRGLDETFAATSHHVSNIQVAFDGPDTARTVAYLYAWHRYADGSPDGELWGRYRHTVARTDAGWRITSLRLEAAGTVDFHRGAMHPIGHRRAGQA